MPAAVAPPPELDRRGYEDFAALLRGEFSEGALAIEDGRVALPPKPQVVWDVQTGHRRRRPAPDPEDPPPEPPPPAEEPPGRPPWEDPEVGPPGWQPRKRSDLLRSTAPGEFAAHRLPPRKTSSAAVTRGAEIMAAVENSSGQQQALIDGILEQCDKVSRMILLATANALREANASLSKPQPWFTARAAIKKELTHMAGLEEFNRVVDMAKIDHPDDDSILLRTSAEERQEKDRMEAFFKSSVKVVKRNVNSHDFDMQRVQRRLKMHGKDAESVLLHTTNGLDPEYFGRAVNSLLKNSGMAAASALSGYESGQHKLFTSYAQNLQDTRLAYESLAPVPVDAERLPELVEAAQAASQVLITPLEEKDLKNHMEQQKKSKEKLVWELKAQFDGLSQQKRRLEEEEEQKQPAKGAGGAQAAAQGAVRLAEAESLEDLADAVEELRFERVKVKEQLKNGGPQIERMVEFMENGSHNMEHTMDEILKMDKKSDKVSRALQDIAVNEGRQLVWDMIRNKEVAVELLDPSVLPLVEEEEEPPPETAAIIEAVEDPEQPHTNVSEMLQESREVTNAQLVAAARKRQHLRQDKEALEQELAEKQAEAEAKAAEEEAAAAAAMAQMDAASSSSSSASADMIDPGLLKQLRSLATTGNVVLSDIRSDQKENEVEMSTTSAALMDHAKEAFQKMAKVSKKDAAESEEELLEQIAELADRFAEMQIQFSGINAAGEEGHRSLQRSLSKRLTMSVEDLDEADLHLKQDELQELENQNAQRERRLERLKEALATERDESQTPQDALGPASQDPAQQESLFETGSNASFGSEFNSETGGAEEKPHDTPEAKPAGPGPAGPAAANEAESTAAVGRGSPAVGPAVGPQPSLPFGPVETTRSASSSSAAEENVEEARARDEERLQKVKELRDARGRHAELQADIAAAKKELEALLAGAKSPASPRKTVMTVDFKVPAREAEGEKESQGPPAAMRLDTSELETDTLEDLESEPPSARSPSKGKLATLIRAHSEQIFRTRTEDGEPVQKAKTMSLFSALGSHKSLSQQKHKLTQAVKQVKTEVQKKKKLLMAMIPKDNLQDLINAGVFQAADVGGMGAKQVPQEAKEDNEVTRLKDKLDVLKKSVEFWQKRLEHHVQKYHVSVTDALHASATAEETARAAQAAAAAAAAAAALAPEAARAEDTRTSISLASPRRETVQGVREASPAAAEASPSGLLGPQQPSAPILSPSARDHLNKMKAGRISGMAMPSKGRDARGSLRHESRSTVRGAQENLTLAGFGGGSSEVNPLSPSSALSLASPVGGTTVDMHSIEEEVLKSSSQTPRKSALVRTRVQAYLASKRMAALAGTALKSGKDSEEQDDASSDHPELPLPGRQRPESLDDLGQDSDSSEGSDSEDSSPMSAMSSPTSHGDARQRLARALKTAKVTAHMRMVAAQIRDEARKAEKEMAERSRVMDTPRLSAGEYALNLVKAAGLDWEEAERLVDMIALIPAEFIPIVYQYLMEVLGMPLAEQRSALKALSLGHVDPGSPLRSSGDGAKSLGVASLLATQILAMKTAAGLWDPKKTEESDLVTALEADKEEDEHEERPPVEDEEDGKRLLAYYKMKSRMSVKNGSRRRKANRTKRTLHRSVVRSVRERQEMLTPRTEEETTPQSIAEEDRPALPMATPGSQDHGDGFHGGVDDSELSPRYFRRSSSLRYRQIWREDSMGNDGKKGRAEFRRRSSELRIDWDSDFWRDMADRVRDHKAEKYEEAQERRREEWKRLGIEAEGDSSSSNSSPRRQAEVVNRAGFQFGGLQHRTDEENPDSDKEDALKVKRAKTVMNVPDEQAATMRRAFLLGDLGLQETPTSRRSSAQAKMPRKPTRAATWKGNLSLALPHSPVAKRGAAQVNFSAAADGGVSPAKSLPPAFLDRALKARATLHAPSVPRRRSPSPTSGFVKLEGGRIQFTGLDSPPDSPTTQQEQHLQHLFGMMRARSKERMRGGKKKDAQEVGRKYDFRRASTLFWRQRTKHLRKAAVKSLYERSLTRQIVERARPVQWRRKKRRLHEEVPAEPIPTARRMSRRESAPKITLAAAMQSASPAPKQDPLRLLHIGREVQAIHSQYREEPRPIPHTARLPARRQIQLQAPLRHRSVSPSKEPLPEPKLKAPPPGWAKRGAPAEPTQVVTEVSFPSRAEASKVPKLEKGTSNPEAKLPPREPWPKPKEEPVPAAPAGPVAAEPPKSALLPPKKMAEMPLMEAQECLKANLMLFQRSRGRSPERADHGPPPPPAIPQKPPGALPTDIERLWPTQGLKPIVPPVSSLNKGGGAPMASFLQGLLPGPPPAIARKQPLPPEASDVSAKATEILRYLQSFERAPLERMLAQPRRASAGMQEADPAKAPPSGDAAKKEDVRLPPIGGDKPGSRGLSAQKASWAEFLEQRLGRHVRAASKSTPSPPRSVRGRELRSLLLD